MNKEVMNKVNMDKTRGEIYFENQPHGVHCEYYSVYWQKTIERAEAVNGEKIVRETARDAVFEELTNLFEEKQPENYQERTKIAQKYFQKMGYGKVKLSNDTEDIELEHSHFGKGWKKQWGEQEKTKCTAWEGFLEATLASTTINPKETYRVREKQCIAQGKEKCIFEVQERR